MSWPRIELKRIAPPETSEKQFSADEVVWHLTLDQIESGTGEIKNPLYRPAKEAGNSTYVFDKENVLYSKLRPYLNKVVCPDETGIATTELIPLKPIKNILHRKYLTYFLLSQRFLAYASQMVAGAKMPRIVMAKFWDYKIPLPPISEQRRIVEILDQADALRKKRAEADEKTARILSAIFYKMFGDPATNPMGWEVVSGAEIFRKVGYGVGSPPPFSTEGIPFLRAGNIKPQGIKSGKLAFFDSVHGKSIARSLVHEGDIVIVRRGAYTGDCVVIPEEYDGAYVGYDLICKPSAKTNPHWFAAAWNYPTIWQRIEALRSRAAQQGLNKNQIENFSLPRPPIEKQTAFADKIKAIKRISVQTNNVSSGFNVLFKTILNKAFNGDLTAKWRESHMKELLSEMEEQTKLLEQDRAK